MMGHKNGEHQMLAKVYIEFLIGQLLHKTVNKNMVCFGMI